MSANLTFTLGLDNKPLLSALNAAQSAVGVFSRQAQNLASGVSASFRAISGSVRGSITLLHEIPGAIQTAQSAMNTLLGPVKLAAQIETARVQFRVLIGDVERADAIFSKLSKLADDNPLLDLSDVAKAAALLASTPIEKSDIPEFLTQLGQAAGDAEKFSQMAVAASQVLAKGGKIQGDELLQFANAGLPVVVEMAKVLGLTGAEFTKLQEQGEVTWDTLAEAIRNLTTGTGQYAGMAAAAAQTTEGKWNAVTTAVQQAQRAFGEKIMVALSPVLDQALNLAQELVPWAEKAGEKLRDMAIFLLAAFKSNQLGAIISESLKLAALSFLDLMGRGLIAVGEKLGETLQEMVLTLGDKITLALPGIFTDADKRSDAKDRETARANGTYPKSKSLGDHFDEARTGLEKPIGELSNSVANRISAVQPYADLIRHDIEYSNSEAGRKDSKTPQGRPAGMEKTPDKNDGWLLPTPQLFPDRSANPWIRRPWRPSEWQGPLQDGQTRADVMAGYSQMGGLGPSGGIGGTGSIGGSGGGSGGGYDGGGGGTGSADPADPYGDRGRKSSPFSRAEKSLLSSFNRQAGGRGKRSWQDWLGDSVRTAGISQERLGALRGMDPEGLTKVATNRPNRTREEREKHAADMRERQKSQGGDIGTSVRSITTDVRTIKDHLSKLQVQ